MNPAIQQMQNERRAQFAQQNKTAKKGQTVFVGSSLMESFPIERMQQGLNLDHLIYNRGIRATTTADLLASMDSCIFDLEPGKIFINIGSNDISFNVPQATFLANYDEILRQIKERLPETKVYVMTYFPVNPNNTILASASSKVAQLAQKYHFEFINVNAGLADADGNLQAALTFDGTHLLPAGYDIVLKNMQQYL